MGRLPAALLVAAVLLAGCGGSDSTKDPAQNVPATGGLREKVRAAQSVTAADFPAAGGRTLQQVANQYAAGPELGMASSVFTPGQNRVAFGMIDGKSGFVYGKTALYVARGPNAKASGPYPAPADVLLTQGRYRSKQAASESDPFAAVYAAQVPFKTPGKYAILAVTNDDGKTVAAPGQLNVVTKVADRIPEVGQRMPPHFVTDTKASAKGDISKIDTRQPPDDMHDTSFDQVVGKKPVALVIATPQLCQSRVCGPVVDVAEQMKSRYGKQVEFIHQEVYKNNDPKQGLRTPLERLNLATEPWLFVVGKDGRITARLEGSFGLSAFEKALKTGL
jgi:hypothetical protein